MKGMVKSKVKLIRSLLVLIFVINFISCGTVIELDDGSRNIGEVPSGGGEGSTFEYQIGDIGPSGGCIFYVDEEELFEWTYLEASSVGGEVMIKWNDPDAEILQTFAYQRSLGWGDFNTGKIISVLGEYNEESNVYAAGYCDDLRYIRDGIAYRDFFLPSLFELRLMYRNLHRSGLCEFDSGRKYWSSSELEEDHEKAHVVWFEGGLEGFEDKDFPNYHVRCVRAF